MLNARYEYRRDGKRNKAHDGARAIFITKDLGSTWTDHETICTGSKALPEPVCQASIIRVASKKDSDAQNILAFVNPNSPVVSKRDSISLQLSYDEGQTWTHKTLLRPHWCSGYSSMAMVDKETIGVLYETVSGLIFEKVKVSDVPRVK